MTFIPLISNTNSTDIPLIANGTYVGISELVPDYNSAFVIEQIVPIILYLKLHGIWIL